MSLPIGQYLRHVTGIDTVIGLSGELFPRTSENDQNVGSEMTVLFPQRT